MEMLCLICVTAMTEKAHINKMSINEMNVYRVMDIVETNICHDAVMSRASSTFRTDLSQSLILPVRQSSSHRQSTRLAGHHN